MNRPDLPLPLLFVFIKIPATCDMEIYKILGDKNSKNLPGANLSLGKNFQRMLEGGGYSQSAVENRFSGHVR